MTREEDVAEVEEGERTVMRTPAEQTSAERTSAERTSTELEAEISEVYSTFQLRFTELRKSGTIIARTHRYQYSREFKLSTISFVKQYALPRQFADGTTGEPRMSKYKAAQIIGISGKMLQHWLQDEDTILQLRVGQKKDSKGRPAKLSELEQKLHDSFMELRKLGKKIRRAWFLVEGRRLYREIYPGNVYTDPVTKTKRYPFKFSNTWFARFQRHF